MDLSTIDTTATANEGVDLELRGPDGALLTQDNGTPITIKLLGKDSDVFVREINANSNRALKQRGKPQTAEAQRADAIRLLAKCTVSWNGIKVSGEALACTYENAVAIYSKFAFIREQVDEFIAERANFTKASPTA